MVKEAKAVPEAAECISSSLIEEVTGVMREEHDCLDEIEIIFSQAWDHRRWHRLCGFSSRRSRRETRDAVLSVRGSVAPTPS